MTESTVYNQVFDILKSALWGEERFPYRAPEDVDWDELYKELKAQTVQCLPLDILARENPASSRQYIAAAGKGMMRWYHIMEQQQEICGILRDAGIGCAVVKGASAACYYPQPANRMMGDIDLLVSPEAFDRACGLISEGAEFLGENYRHVEYKRNGLVVEVHRGFAIFHDAAKNAVFDARVFGALDRAEEVCLDGYSFFRLPSAENGLTLLEHINNHLQNGLGLRQIVDWMLYVDRELDDEVWERDFAPFLRGLEREKLAVTVTRMCQMYLGLREDITWCAGADEALCRELMEYILYQGNFGRKNETGSNCATNVISTISVSRSPAALFRILQQRGLINLAPVLERRPVLGSLLRPFAWLYQLGRYARKGLSTEHPLAFLRTAMARSTPQNTLLERLGVSRIEEEAREV